MRVHPPARAARRVVRARTMLLAALVAAVVLPSTTAAAAERADRRPAAADTDRAIFTGSFVARPVVTGIRRQPLRTYQVEVAQVFGPLDVTTERVTVRSRIALEDCAEPGTGGQGGQPGPGGATAQPGPDSTSGAAPIDRQRRLFDATVQGEAYVVARCDDAVLASDTVLAQVVEQFGQGRPPGSPSTPEPEPFDDVAYLCPDTRDAVTDLDDPAGCETLGDDEPFDRAAAPGLALVIVGLLGLFLARRLGRRR